MFPNSGRRVGIITWNTPRAARVGRLEVVDGTRLEVCMYNCFWSVFLSGWAKKGTPRCTGLVPCRRGSGAWR